VLQELVTERAVLRPTDPELSLTPQGRDYAAKVVRGYRLWQRFLTEYPDQSSSLVDLDVQHIDEHLTPEVIRGLERELSAEGKLPLLPRAATSTARQAGGSA
jgi:Mn-dependent DtxR family transcriptional regulator